MVGFAWGEIMANGNRSICCCCVGREVSVFTFSSGVVNWSGWRRKLVSNVTRHTLPRGSRVAPAIDSA